MPSNNTNTTNNADKNTDTQNANKNLQNTPLTKAEVMRLERKLAKFANLMDSIVRLPFTKQGVGADAALSSVPFAGDIAGLILTGYAFYQGLKIGVPTEKMLPAVRLAIIDLIVGIIPAAGTVMDIFIRPSRKTLEIVHDHIQENYDIDDDFHIQRPFLHESLEKKQQTSSFWRHPLVAWMYLHIPDFLGLLFLIMIGFALYAGTIWIMGLFK